MGIKLKTKTDNIKFIEETTKPTVKKSDLDQGVEEDTEDYKTKYNNLQMEYKKLKQEFEDFKKLKAEVINVSEYEKESDTEESEDEKPKPGYGASANLTTC